MGLVDLTVNLWYNGPKARDFYPGSSPGIQILRIDLVALKLPLPKTENITITKLPNGIGACVFVWPNATYGGVLYKHLKTRIYGPDDDGARKCLLNELSMLSLQEEHHSPASRKKERTHNKQPMYHHKQWRRSDVHSGEPALQNEAQMLLDDMASAFKIPKKEPIDPPIPDESFTLLTRGFPARDSVASSVLSPPVLGVSLGVRSNEREVGSPMSISSSWQASPVPPKPIKTQPISPTIPPLPLPQQESDFTPPGLIITQAPARAQPMQTQTRRSTQIQTQTRPVTQLPSPTRSSRKRSRSPSFDMWAHPPSTRPNPVAHPTPNGHENHWNGAGNGKGNGNGNGIAGTQSEVARLTRELWNVRRQITAGVAREASIMSELRALDPQSADANADTSRKALEDAAMRTRLQEIEAELTAERRLRIQAEAALMDVQRECREPFVVPALFDAFFMISKVTTQVMDSLGSEAAASAA